MTLTKGVDAQLRYPYDLHSRGSDYFLIEILEYKAHSGGFEGGFKVAGIDAALMGTADIVIQNTEKQLGMREALDPNRVGIAAITGGIFSFASNAAVDSPLTPAPIISTSEDKLRYPFS